MSSMRIYEFAKDNNMSSKAVLEIARQNGADIKSHMATIDEGQQQQLKQWIQAGGASKQQNSEPRQPKQAKDKQTDKQNSNRQSKTNKEKSQATSKNKKTNPSNKQQAKQSNPSNNQNRQTDQGQGNDQGGRRRRRNRRGRNRQNNQQQAPKGSGLTARKHKDLPETLVYTEGMNIQEIAKILHRDATEIIKRLMMLGVMANQNQALSKDVIELIALDYGIDAQEKEVIDVSDLDIYFQTTDEDKEKESLRPPVVTIMGHVDHGKTTLLDKLRDARVTEGEAGGITQHIGAYQVEVEGRPITFLDTPGHEAFTTMRARGANVTDIAIIVVAADDGVMPQTVEAINHAKAAEVPIIVAVNKIDKPTANPDRVKQELTEYEIIPEDWGGDNIFVEISALQGTNLDELLEMVLLVAEVEDLKANPDRLAIGSVIEARLDKAQGSTATLLVQAGTLQVGDPIVVGDTYGRVRTMTNDQGRRIQKAGPATPVEITGLNDAPQAGDLFAAFEDEKTARSIGETRQARAMDAQRANAQKITLDNLFDTLQEGEMRSVNVVLKGDVQGSVEALSASLQKIDVEGVKVNIVHKAVGAINESDISLAAASGAIVIGFNVRPTPQARAQADQEEIDIRTYRVIYDAIEEVEQAMKGMLDPEYEEQVTGHAVVRETYTVSKLGTIAGSFVQEGVVERSSFVRLLRDNIVIYEGEISSLRRFQDDVREVAKGYECGIMLDNYNDIKVDDIIEAYKMVEVER